MKPHVSLDEKTQSFLDDVTSKLHYVVAMQQIMFLALFYAIEKLIWPIHWLLGVGLMVVGYFVFQVVVFFMLSPFIREIWTVHIRQLRTQSDND